MYMQFCPVVSIAHIQNIQLAGIISLVVIFGAEFFIERFWCNYLCPFGALLNLAQYLGKLLHIHRSKIMWYKDNCTSCIICNNICLMRIDIQKSNEIEDVECIHCRRCRINCPVESNINKDK